MSYVPWCQHLLRSSLRHRGIFPPCYQEWKHSRHHVHTSTREARESLTLLETTWQRLLPQTAARQASRNRAGLPLHTCDWFPSRTYVGLQLPGTRYANWLPPSFFIESMGCRSRDEVSIG